MRPPRTRPARNLGAALVLAAAALSRRGDAAGCTITFDKTYVTAAAPVAYAAVASAPATPVTFTWTVDWDGLKAMCPGTVWATHFELGAGPVGGSGLMHPALAWDSGRGDLPHVTSRTLTVKQITDGLAAAGIPATADLMWLVWVRPQSDPTSAVGANGTFRIAAGPPDLVLIASPPAGWPAEFVVKNLGAGPSDATLLRATVALQQADVDAVARNCTPKFVDFEDVVPSLQPKTGLATVRVLTQIRPEALAAWNALNKPATRIARPSPPKTPTPLPNPVQQMVTCRYTLTAALGAGQNQADPHPQDNSVRRDIVEYVPFK